MGTRTGLSMNTKIITSVVLAAAATFVAPAFAESERAAIPYANVRHADLDLNNDRDAARLLRRLNQAADDVCEGHRRPPGSLLFAGRDVSRERQAYDACRAEALDSAVAAFNHPVVNTMHLARGGHVRERMQLAATQR